MTHGTPTPPFAPINLAIVTPGPTLTTYLNGAEAARITLTPDEASYLAAQLIIAAQMRGIVRQTDSSWEPPPITTLPNENLPFADHMARRGHVVKPEDAE